MNKEQVILKEYNQNNHLTNIELSQKTGISIKIIERTFRKNNIKKKRANFIPKNKIILSKNDIEYMVSLYNSGYSCTFISKKMCISTSTVNINLKQNGVIFRNTEDCHKTLKINNLFEKIDNQLSAYFLGILYADGCVSNTTNTTSINPIESEKPILEKFSYEVFGKYNLKMGKKKKSHHTQNYIVSINDSKMKNSLIKLGCVPNKSLILKFPTSEQVPDHLIRHFIRGYFDGDGGVSSKNNSLCIVGSCDFIQDLSKILYSNKI